MSLHLQFKHKKSTSIASSKISLEMLALFFNFYNQDKRIGDWAFKEVKASSFKDQILIIDSQFW